MMNIRAICCSLLLLTLTACSDKDPWVLTETESPFDGRVTSVARQFAAEGNPTLVEVKLECAGGSRLTVSVGSYLSESNNSVHEGAPFILDGDGDVVGRIAFNDFAGQRQQRNVWEVFTTGEYENIMNWKVAETASQTMLVVAPDKFFALAATVVPGGQSAQDLRAVATSGEYQLPILASLSEGDPLFGLRYYSGDAQAQAELQAATLVHLASEVYEYAEQAGKTGPFASGAFMRKLLPVSIEVRNSGGAMAITIPAENKNVMRVLEACGEPAWWDTAAPVAAPAAPSEPSAPEPVLASEHAGWDVQKVFDDAISTCTLDLTALRAMAAKRGFSAIYRGTKVSGVAVHEESEDGMAVNIFFDEPYDDLADALDSVWPAEAISRGSRGAFLMEREIPKGPETAYLFFTRIRGSDGSPTAEARLHPDAPASAYQIFECVINLGF
jgi:hypothetical protein